MDNTRRHPGDPDPKRELLDQNPKEHDETRRQGLVRPTNNSAKIDNLRGTPTRELGENSKQEQSSKTSNDSTKTGNAGDTSTRELGNTSETSAFGPEWMQKQLGDLRKRPEFTAKQESTELRAGDGKTTDQPILQKSEEQQTRERRLEGRNRLQVDYQRYLRNPIAGF